MKKIYVLLLGATLMTACHNHENAFFKEWDTPYGTAPFSQIKESDYIPAVKEGIRIYREEIDAIVNNPEAATFENTIAALESSGKLYSQVIGVFFNLSESDSTPEIQKIDEEITPLVTEVSDEVYMNEGLFERVKAVHDNQEGLSREQQMVVKKYYEGFVRNGVGLEAEAKARFKEINAELAVLSQAFGNNLLAENNAFKAECGITVSAYPEYMASCSDRAAREKAFKAYSSRGNNGNANDNNEIVLKIMKLRTEKAQLLGYKNSAEFLLDNKMAGNPTTVDNFLAEIMASSMKKAKQEIADMQEIMDAEVAEGLLPEGSKIEAWDWWYYAEKVKKAKYDVDENETRPYFQADSVRKGVFYAASKLYGISFEEAPEVEVYNPEVKAYRLNDENGNLLGIFYCDYFSRDTKRGGAWMNNFRDQKVENGEDVRPIIVNVCNFPPASEEQPSLLTVDDVQTAFHEFGHALHGFLTKCTYPSVSGTSVARDFVECFSQFNEHWAFEPEITAHYAHHYLTGEVIPEALVAKINNALTFNQGFTTGELCAASILDMKWHELTMEELEQFTDAQSIRDFETKACKEMGLIDEIIPRYRSTYFNHIFNSGYSAGYYSYLWAEVLERDAFEYFVARGKFNPEVARSFKECFLEKGGSEEPMTLYRQFRGADPDPKALLRGRGLE